MAKSKLDLAVESGSWEAGLKKACTSLKNFEEACGGVGNATKEQEQRMAQFVKMFGNMETTAKTAKGQLNELKTAFTNLTSEYNKLSEKEKQSPFGKAMSQSLEQLKGRIQTANTEMRNIQNEMNGTTEKSNSFSGALQGVAEKLGINVGLLGKAATTAGIAAGAYEVAQHAVESLEVTHDALARTMQECEAVTNSFLTSLASGNFDNFLNGLQGVIEKAQAAYNALDDLESFNVRYNPKAQIMEGDISTKLQQARAAKAQGDVKKATQLVNEAKSEIKQLEALTATEGRKESKFGYQEIRRQVANASNNRINLTKGQIDYYVDPKNWDKVLEKAQRYEKLMKAAKADMVGGVQSAGATAEAKAAGEAARAELKRDQSLARAWTYVNVRDSGDSEAAQRWNKAHEAIYGTQRAEQRTASLEARADRMGGILSGASTKTGGGKTGGKTSATSILGVDTKEMEGLGGSLEDMQPKAIEARESVKQLAAELNRLKQAADETTDMQERKTLLARADSVKNSIKNNDLVQPGGIIFDTDAMFAQMQSDLDNHIFVAKVQTEDTGKGVKNAQQTQQAWSAAAQAMQNAGSALQNMNSEGANVAGIVMQAIANVALGFAQASASKATGAAGVFGWIAAATAGVATMTATIASIKSATKGYAEGGVISGGAYTGDSVPIMANAGEVVLSQSMQSNLASNLQAGQQQGGNARTTISGEQLVTVINNYGRRTGRGEILR